MMLRKVSKKMHSVNFRIPVTGKLDIMQWRGRRRRNGGVCSSI
jgi:hypothetical protein